MKPVFIKLAALALLLSASVTHAQNATAVRVHCPVVGMPEAKAGCCPSGYCNFEPRDKFTVNYKGGKLQLCCVRCVKIFNDSPAKFAVAANHQLVVTGQARQLRCPLTGRAFDPKLSVEVSGVPIYFASAEMHKKIAEATPFVRSHLVFGDQGFARGFAVVTEKKGS